MPDMGAFSEALPNWLRTTPSWASASFNCASARATSSGSGPSSRVSYLRSAFLQVGVGGDQGSLQLDAAHDGVEISPRQLDLISEPSAGLVTAGFEFIGLEGLAGRFQLSFAIPAPL